MSLEINLLIKKKEISPLLTKANQIVKGIAFAGSLIFILLTIAVFVVQFLFARQVLEIQNRKAEVKKKIEALQSTESTYIAFNQKLSAITVLLKDRFTPAETYKKLKKITPQGSSLSSIVLENEKGSSTIGVITNLEDFDTIVAGLLNQKELPITDINMTGLNRIGPDKYDTTFSIKIGKEVKITQK